MSTPIFAVDVIAAALEAQSVSGSIASDIITALEQAGVVVLNPQDVAWGECPDNVDFDAPGKNGPHEISTSLCVWCLEYDPE